MFKLFLVRRNDHCFGKPQNHFCRIDLTKIALKKIILKYVHLRHKKIRGVVKIPSQLNQYMSLSVTFIYLNLFFLLNISRSPITLSDELKTVAYCGIHCVY